MFGIGPAATFIIIAAALIISGIKILKEYERAVVFRLGRMTGRARGPGIIYVIPGVEKMVKMDLRTVTMDIPPQDVQRAMAKQAEAERERRAKVIHADGEFQASQKLADAAAVIGQQPMALQLRFLQSLVEVASEKNSTTIFPVPIDLLTPFLKKDQK